jgi:hypothetical protein
VRALIILISFLISGSCSNLRHIRATTKDAIPYIKEFQRDFDHHVTVPVTMEPLDLSVAANCTTYTDGYRQVRLNKILWPSLSHEQKKILVYHELIHCEFYMGHSETTQFTSGCPQSIMKPDLFTPYQSIACFEQNKQYYISEINMRRVFK